MRVLFCTPRLPMPSMKGDQIIAFQRLQHLAPKHQITLLSFYEQETELGHVPRLKEMCEAVHLVKLDKFHSAQNMVAGIFRLGLPFQVSYYSSKVFRAKLQQLLHQHDFDLVHGFLIRLSPYFDSLQIPLVLEAIDSMVLNFERRLQQEQGLKRLFFAEELRRLKIFEPRAIVKSAATLVVSSIDQHKMGNPKVSVVPVGVDTDFFVPKNAPNPQRVIFSGNMSYEPNITAVRWFVRYCFEQVKAQVPNFQLVIAGANPSPEITDLAKIPSIQVTGRVPSMVTALQDSQISIAPMRSGSGQQIKILEAMACGLPVITTTLGLGDIKATPEAQILVADEPDQFTAALVRLLRDPNLCQALGQRARHFIVENHSWNNINRKVDLVYQSIHTHMTSV